MAWNFYRTGTSESIIFHFILFYFLKLRTFFVATFYSVYLFNLFTLHNLVTAKYHKQILKNHTDNTSCVLFKKQK